MKKNTIILLIGAALGIFAYRYFFAGGLPLGKTVANAGAFVSATYIGPDKLRFEGGHDLGIKNGDVITGTLNNDGSLSQRIITSWSQYTLTIPAEQITNIVI